METRGLISRFRVHFAHQVILCYTKQNYETAL